MIGAVSICMYGSRTSLFVSLQQIRSHSLLLSASFARDQRVQHSVRSLRWQPTCSYVACCELVWASMINSSLSPKRHVSGNKTSTVQKTCAATYSSLKRSEYPDDRLALQECQTERKCARVPVEAKTDTSSVIGRRYTQQQADTSS